MDDHAYLRQKKLEEHYKAGLDVQQKVKTLEGFVRPHMLGDAWQRYTTLKLAHQETAMQLLAMLAQAARQGHLKEPISDKELKTLLVEMHKEKKEFRIRK